MVDLQITYNDVENILATASIDKPYLVYSYRLKNLPKPSGENKINNRLVFVCWVGKEEKEDVAKVILDDSSTRALVNVCLEVREKGGKTKFIPFLYDTLQRTVLQMNLDSKRKESDDDTEVRNRFAAKLESYTNHRKTLLSQPFDRYLKDRYDVYDDFAREVLENKNVTSRYIKTDVEVVQYLSRYFLLPKGCEYLVKGTIEKDYYNKFKENESTLDSQLALALSYQAHFKVLAKEMEDRQNLIDEKIRLENKEEERKENNKTFLGKIKNILNR